MSETPAASAAETPQQPAGTPPEGEQEPETFTREYVEKLRQENAKYRTKAAENGDAAKAAEKARLAAMSDGERAVAEAEARGRSAAVTEYGKRLARTEFDALAGRRNPDVDTAAVLEYVDLGKFLDDTGEPDTKAIKAAVDRLVSAPAGGAPSFDGGARTTTPAPADMNSFIRSATGRA